MTEMQFREALALHRQSRLAEAALAYQAVLDRQPQHVQALTFLGVIAFQLNHFERAAEFATRALEIDAGSTATHLVRAHSLALLGKSEAAVAAYDRVIILKPDFEEAHLHKGHVLRSLGRFEDAITSYDRAIAAQPQFAECYFNRGLAECHLSRYDAALVSFDRAIALNPRYAEAYDSRGNVLTALERFDAALASYNVSISLLPQDPDTHCNRGNLLVDLGRYPEALASFECALALDSEHAQTYFSRSFVFLLLGDLVQGWRDFEWRWKNEHCATSREKRNFAQPQWRGEPLDAKTILVCCEQGLGDTIQFCRYIEIVAMRGATVILEAPQPLHSLLGSLRGVSQLVAKDDPLPPFDYYCPLLSLPWVFNTTLEAVPWSGPYLRADAERARYWKAKLGERTHPRVGLAWSGGFRPNQAGFRSVDSRRNIPLEMLASLNVSGIEFFSLQKGEPAESQLTFLRSQNWAGPALNDCTDELHDFQETAALIEQLDLVISVDTSIAHLAGAIGKPVWILNRFDTCWRWMLNRADSPWYPTAFLFRQETRGDWWGVVQNVRSGLERVAAASRA